jgi:hypothetical protein
MFIIEIVSQYLAKSRKSRPVTSCVSTRCHLDTCEKQSVLFTFSSFMGQPHSCEGNSGSASQEIRRLLWNPECHYPFCKSPLLAYILTQIISVYTLFLKIDFSIAFSSTTRSSKSSSLTLMFSH